MGTFPLSRTLHIFFLLLVLVVVCRQIVPIFPTHDLTSFCLSKFSATGLWLLRRPFLYTFVYIYYFLDTSSIQHLDLTFHLQWGYSGEVPGFSGLLPVFIFGSLMSSIQYPGYWWQNMLQATLKPFPCLLSAYRGVFWTVVPCICVCQVYPDCGLALVSPLLSSVKIPHWCLYQEKFQCVVLSFTMLFAFHQQSSSPCV